MTPALNTKEAGYLPVRKKVLSFEKKNLPLFSLEAPKRIVSDQYCQTFYNQEIFVNVGFVYFLVLIWINAKKSGNSRNTSISSSKSSKIDQFF